MYDLEAAYVEKMLEPGGTFIPFSSLPTCKPGGSAGESQGRAAYKGFYSAEQKKQREDRDKQQLLPCS